MTASRHLILATAVGYTWEQVAPFVRSLRRTGYRGDVLMLVGSLAPADRSRLQAEQVTLCRVQPLFGRLPQLVRRKICARKLRGLHAGIRALWHRPPPPAAWTRAGSAWMARYFEHITCSRYDYYRRFLQRHGARYDRVMTSDTRDVVFQADPFSGAADAALACFLEHRTTTLGGEISNANWIRAVYGEEVLARLADRPVSCSGITQGTTAGMLAYFEAMTGEFIRTLPRGAGLPFIDQAVHNYLLWTGALPAARAVPNYAGPVFTMHGVPEAEIHVAASGHLLDDRGTLIPVLHQFDRHPGHVERLRALLT